MTVKELYAHIGKLMDEGYEDFEVLSKTNRYDNNLMEEYPVINQLTEETLVLFPANGVEKKESKSESMNEVQPEILTANDDEITEVYPNPIQLLANGYPHGYSQFLPGQYFYSPNPNYPPIPIEEYREQKKMILPPTYMKH